MTGQTDLFAPVPAALAMCRDCVHRNAVPTDAWGYCTPRGWRAWHYEPCEVGFARSQLGLDARGRPLATGAPL